MITDTAYSNNFELLFLDYWMEQRPFANYEQRGLQFLAWTPLRPLLRLRRPLLDCAPLLACAIVTSLPSSISVRLRFTCSLLGVDDMQTTESFRDTCSSTCSQCPFTR